MTASWGQGITSSPKEGLASGELVTWRSQPKTVPIPLEEAKQTPLGQVWVRAGDELSRSGLRLQAWEAAAHGLWFAKRGRQGK